MSSMFPKGSGPDEHAIESEGSGDEAPVEPTLSREEDLEKWLAENGEQYGIGRSKGAPKGESWRRKLSDATFQRLRKTHNRRRSSGAQQ